MSDASCEEIHLLLQADLDGELRPAEAARVAVHLEHCADCASVQTRLIALSQRLRRDIRPLPVPASLRARVDAALAAAGSSQAPSSHAPFRPEVAARPPAGPRWWARPSAAFGAGFALAASLALVAVLPRDAPDGDAPATEMVVAAHIRALQPGHLMDVASEDRHTVKPWFDGRLAYAPPVKDLAAQGFPLAGGRLDYVAGRTAAAMVYRRGLHVIDLFAAPGTDRASTASTRASSRDGYNVLSWRQDGATFWAISDLNEGELAEFVRDWRGA